MSSRKPTKITVDFDGGLRVALDWDSLPFSLRQELERQPALSRPTGGSDDAKYLLLTWADGAREVVKVDASCAEINRYYVISRLEEVGRLSLNKPDGYPHLVEINRRPQELKSITFEGSFSLQEEKSLREGKKTDHFYSLSAAGNDLEQLKKEMAEVMAKENITPKDLAGDQAESKLELVRRAMGLRALSRQGDVIDFMLSMAKNM